MYYLTLQKLRSVAVIRARQARTLLALMLAALFSTVHAAQTDARLAPGSGVFSFPFVIAGESRNLKVWYHRPAAAGADAPIVFVMHGTGRNGEGYREAWIPFADAGRFVLLTPEFSRAQFGGNYDLERLSAADGTPIPQAQWPYAAIENIFDAVRIANGLNAQTYDIYGHSAGSQFVHRLALLLPDARYRVAVAANAGWYTMPDASVSYPYGLAGTNVLPTQLSKALGRKLIVLLGDRDIDPHHPDLRRTPEAMAQGEHRFARGHAFFERARLAAVENNTPFAWSLRIAPGVAHSNGRMAPHAAPLVGSYDQRASRNTVNAQSNCVSSCE